MRLADVNATFLTGMPSKNDCKWQQNFIKIGYNFTNLLNHSTISSYLKGVGGSLKKSYFSHN
jgi:hypothetical protein